MNYIVIILGGFLVGRIIGMIHVKRTKWVNGKSEVDLYMKKTYGSEWTKL